MREYAYECYAHAGTYVLVSVLVFMSMHAYVHVYLCVYKPASVQASLRLSSGNRLRIKEDEVRTRIREQ